LINYGFNFETLYLLDLETLLDIARIILGEDACVAPDYDVIIRGVIIPFLRTADRAALDANKDTVMRLALICVAKRLGVTFTDWDSTDTEAIATAARDKVRSLVAERLEEMDEDERAEVLGVARDNLSETAKRMGVPIAGAGAILAGEISGFGIYLGTTAGLHALSLALGTTFSWGVYQSATTLLGIILGPVGWAVAGVSLVGGLAASIRQWAKAKDDRRMMLVVVGLLFAIGESPFTFFGLDGNATLDEIKTIYRAIVKTLHPDKREANIPQWLHDDFDEKLLRCQEAYEKLQQILQNGAQDD
jgi:hypothetical protein